MELVQVSNVVALRGLPVTEAEVRRLAVREQATVPPPAVPYVSLLTTDPSQKISRVADNAFRIEGTTAQSAILQTLLELTVEQRTVRIPLGRGESARRTAQRIAAAVPEGFRVDARPSLPLGSVLVTIERDDESRRIAA